LRETGACINTCLVPGADKISRRKPDLRGAVQRHFAAISLQKSNARPERDLAGAWA